MYPLFNNIVKLNVNLEGLKKIAITDNIMYDYKKDQVSVIHVTVGGKRQSTKLTNPTDKVVFNF